MYGSKKIPKCADVIYDRRIVDLGLVKKFAYYRSRIRKKSFIVECRFRIREKHVMNMLQDLLKKKNSVDSFRIGCWMRFVLIVSILPVRLKNKHD